MYTAQRLPEGAVRRITDIIGSVLTCLSVCVHFRAVNEAGPWQFDTLTQIPLAVKEGLIHHFQVSCKKICSLTFNFLQTEVPEFVGVPPSALEEAMGIALTKHKSRMTQKKLLWEQVSKVRETVTDNNEHA